MPIDVDELERYLQEERDKLFPQTPQPPAWEAELPKNGTEVKVTIKGAVDQKPKESSKNIPWNPWG